jgi:RNA polymerase sigma-70 factor, ECF subfamily
MAQTDPPGEQALADQARSDPQAFAALYDRFVEPVFLFVMRRTCDRSLAEDVTSSTFERALRHLQRHGWRGRSYLAWLYRIAYHELVGAYRRTGRLVPLAPDHPAGVDVLDQVAVRLLWRDFLQCYGKLRKADQEIIALRLFDGLSNAEAAAFLGRSPQNVSVRLHRALERLRRHLADLA